MQLNRWLALTLMICLNAVTPLSVVHAMDAQGNPTGPQTVTGPQEPIGPQGPTGTQEPTGPQGCVGADCPVVEVVNEETGESSQNTNAVNGETTTETTTTKTVDDTTNATATGKTGGNTQNGNTGAEGIQTGDAGIGVTQVKKDNTTTVGGTAGLQVTGQAGQTGDLQLGFGAGTANLSGSGSNGGSVRAVNETTGSNSTNEATINQMMEEITEVQNDGRINNFLDLMAITGQNQASANTGDGKISTGDASVAATLINLLNTTVINGDLWISVADIFGDLNGNVILPELAAIASALRSSGNVDIKAENAGTGSESTNTIDIDLRDEEVTKINNEAEINTTVNADAITGQNEAEANTRGGFVETGDAQVQASNVAIANTTVEGGNWGLVIVSALNKWLGFLVGEAGQVRALSQEETVREIEARNEQTGENSDNAIAISQETSKETKVENNAEINNEINAQAITGQNEASNNTGAGAIKTGKAAVEATAVNIANTTVKDGSLFIAVVNVLGDWFGDLLYGGQSLLAQANQGGRQVTVDAGNSQTGENSENNIDVKVESRKETTIENDAEINTVLNATVDTGNNRANRNTAGAGVKTGDGFLALHSRAAANLTALMGEGGRSLVVEGLNKETGFDSKNKIRARLNDERVVDITNEANVSTVFAGGANTGLNEVNQNTVAGWLKTGIISGDIGVDNLVNRVLLALAGNPSEVQAELMNRLTGNLSENSNEVGFETEALLNLINRGMVATIIDLLFNTGGNSMNENTAAAASVGGGIATGAVCVDGNIHSDVNGQTLGALGGWSMNVDALAEVVNNVGIQGVTGNNQRLNNTALGGAVETKDCPKIALAPENGGGGDQEEENGNGGGGGQAEDEDDGEEAREGRIAGVTGQGGEGEVGELSQKPRVNGNGLLKRFPVAGGLLTQERWQWERWLALALFGSYLLGWAINRDRVGAGATL
jgi:hypothetical protein